MPKAKLSEEEKQANYAKWLEEAEAQACAKFQEKRPMNPVLEYATKDLNMDYQPFLDALFNMV